MKLATMKLICLLVFLGGAYMLGLFFNISYVQQAQDYVLQYWPTQEDGALNLRMPGAIAGAVLLLIGLYGLLPKLPSRKNAIITFKGAKGNITLQLKPIRKVLLKMMRRMPEVYSIDLNLRPDGDGHRACIEADVILKNCAALGVRQCAKIVAECIDMTARELLGLEDLSTVRVNVEGVHVDATATGKQIREQLALRQAEESSAYASAHPPMAAITLEGGASESTGAQDKAAVTNTESTTEKAAEEKPQSSNVPEPQESAAEANVEPEKKPEQAQPAVIAEEPKSEPMPEPESEVPQAIVPEAVPEIEEVPEVLMSETLHGIDLPSLADDDADLPPAPQINEEGEITSDEAVEDSIADSDNNERTPDSVEVDVLQVAQWSHADLPEPAPDELGNDPSDMDADTEEYPKA